MASEPVVDEAAKLRPELAKAVAEAAALRTENETYFSAGQPPQQRLADTQAGK